MTPPLFSARPPCTSPASYSHCPNRPTNARVQTKVSTSDAAVPARLPAKSRVTAAPSSNAAAQPPPQHTYHTTQIPPSRYYPPISFWRGRTDACSHLRAGASHISSEGDRGQPEASDRVAARRGGGHVGQAHVATTQIPVVQVRRRACTSCR